MGRQGSATNPPFCRVMETLHFPEEITSPSSLGPVC